MSSARSAALARRVTAPGFAGGVAAVVVAAVLYTRFDLYGYMIRDSSIYLYGGQRVIHGQPPYAGEMDPKGPMSSILAGLGVGVAKLFGRSDVIVVRLEFCALAVIGVLGIYLLVLELWHSVVAGVVAAVVFTAFRNYAYNALVGTDGHMPGVVFMIFALWLVVRRNWLLAGAAAALAFLTWQPLFFFPIITLACALAWSPGRRRDAAVRTLAGLAAPTLALVVYYAASGHLTNLVQGLIVYPLTGVVRPATTVGHRVAFFVDDIARLYGPAAILFWLGIGSVLVGAVWTLARGGSGRRAALTSPLVLLVAVTLLYQVAYVLYDYIGYPHTYPLLPYAAVGIGGATAALLHRLPARALTVATAALLTGASALAVACAVVYSEPTAGDGGLRGEQAGACALQRALVPHTPLWTIDDPIPLVLLHRRQPDNFPYVGGGLDVWKVQHTPGGFHGWTRQIRRSRASVVVFESWVSGRYKQPLADWLAGHGYHRGYIGIWQVYVTSAARARMRANSIKLAHSHQLWPLTTDGGRFTVTRCTGVAAG